MPIWQLSKSVRRLKGSSATSEPLLSPKDVSIYNRNMIEEFWLICFLGQLSRDFFYSIWHACQLLKTCMLTRIGMVWGKYLPGGGGNWKKKHQMWSLSIPEQQDSVMSWCWHPCSAIFICTCRTNNLLG